jgi:hypothetical protein
MHCTEEGGGAKHALNLQSQGTFSILSCVANALPSVTGNEACDDAKVQGGLTVLSASFQRKIGRFIHTF